MVSKLHKNNKGFTIIEVLIVLAIAGLIMLIVFLAVPALQRNQRNNARTNDASRVSAAVTECLANRNGVVDSCNASDEIQAGTLSRLNDTVLFGSETYDLDNAYVSFGMECVTEGDDAVAGGGSRAFVVTFMLENDIQRCISS